MESDELDLPRLSFGDIIDKHSILSRKIYFGSEDSISEHRYLEKGMYAWGVDGKLVTNIIRLTQMNIEIWNLENELRNGKDDKFTLEEIGRRACKIRDLNKRRIEYKNKINQLMSGKHLEVKVNHRSGE